MSEDNSEHEIYTEPKPRQAPESQYRSKDFPTEPPPIHEILSLIDRHEDVEYIESIVHELEDHRIAEGQQQREYAIKRKAIKDFEQAMRVLTEQAQIEYIRTHPEAKGLGFRFGGNAYVEKSKDYSHSQVFAQMLDCLVDRKAGFTTQKAVLDSVKTSTGITELTANIWTLPLKKYMKTTLSKRLRNHGVPISIASCIHMSDIRKVLDSHFAKQQAVHKVKLEITFTPNDVIVNNTRYKITSLRSEGLEYESIRLSIGKKRPWVRVQHLKALCGLAVE